MRASEGEIVTGRSLGHKEAQKAQEKSERMSEEKASLSIHLAPLENGAEHKRHARLSRLRNTEENIPFLYLHIEQSRGFAMVVFVRFEFDSGKNDINKAKHGVSFEQAQQLWSVPGVEADLGVVNGEYRYARLAPLSGVVHIVIFTFRAGPAIQLISARKATEKETAFYEANRKK